MGKIVEAAKRAEQEKLKSTPAQSLEPDKAEVAPLPDEGEQIVAEAIKRAARGAAASSSLEGAENTPRAEESDFMVPARLEPAPVEPGPVGPVAPGAETAASVGIRKIPIQLNGSAPVLPFDNINAQASEQYRIVRTKLLHHPNKPRICLITSPGPGDGKTITSINLAGALALSENRVVLVDADLRRSRIACVLGLPETPGLADVLAARCELDDVLIEVEQLPNLHVLPAGNPHPNPTELLDSERWREICAALRCRFRFAIIDVPPMVGIADFEVMLAASDGVVVVVRPDHTNRNLCFKALEMIPKEKMIGITVNGINEWFLWKSYDAYHYHYYSQVGKS